MSVAGWALRHRALVLLVLLSGVFAGVFAASELPSAVYPEIDFPRIGVVVRQGDMPPDLMQTTVLRPVEQALITVLGVRRVRSRTIRGGAEPSLLFAPKTDMWRALQLVESSLADVRASLPPGTLVRVERLTPSSFPILSFNIGGHVDPRVLAETAQFVVRPALSRVRGVGRITVLGGDSREMEVVLDPERSAAAHLRPADLATRIRAALPLVAAGRYDQDRSLVTVLVNSEALGPTEIAAVPLGVDARSSAPTSHQCRMPSVRRPSRRLRGSYRASSRMLFERGSRSAEGSSTLATMRPSRSSTEMTESCENTPPSSLR